MMIQQAYLGKDSIKEILPLLKRHNTKHVFLVRGKGSYVTCGAELVVNKALSSIECSYTEFYDFSENPKFEDMERGIALLNNSEADIIVAVGGGSVLDMAKLIRFFNSYKGEITGKSFQKNNNLLPLIAIPTTAGTGAEATRFAVVYKDKTKYSAEHDDMLPDYAIIYPPFTYGNPKYLTACTGFDALAQGIEAYWNVNATEESDEYAIKAIKLLWPNLPIAVNNPNVDVRNKVAEGAYWAGKAINLTKTTAPHAFSYAFTTHLGYPHGHAVALTFPYFFQINTTKIKGSYKFLCDNHKYWNKMIKLKRLLNIESNKEKQQMEEYINLLFANNKKMDSIDFKYLKMVNIQRLLNNPIQIDDFIIDEIFDYFNKYK